MTLVTITLTVPDGQVGDPESPAVGYQQWKPVGPGARRRAESPAREVLPAPFRVDLLPGSTTIEVAPTTASWVWLVREYVGAGTNTRAIAVPDQPTIDYRDCPRVDPASLTVVGPAPDPIWQQQVDALTAEIGAALAHSEAAALSASAAATSASNAAGSATSASTSATTATGAATTATNAASSATASATSASTSATSATASKDAAATSATSASGAATNAASSATAAATSAATATTKGAEASASAATATAEANEAEARAATVASQVLTPDPTYPGLYRIGA